MHRAAGLQPGAGRQRGLCPAPPPWPAPCPGRAGRARGAGVRTPRRPRLTHAPRARMACRGAAAAAPPAGHEEAEMGLLIDGRWVDQWYDTDSTGGKFVRGRSQFRNWVTADGSAGPTGGDGFKAEPGRYLLYVSLACPWAHRTLIFRQLKGLAGMIDVAVVNPYMAENGWTFEPGPGVTGDPLGSSEYLYQVYLRADPGYSGRVTVPVLWDRERGTIVSNESADIIRMLNSAFDGVGAAEGDYAPADLLERIDEVNAHVYETINNGVYKAGFATAQE